MPSARVGFRTVGLGDTTPVGDVSETVVYYGSRSPTTEAAAERVARSMTGAVIMAYDPSQVTDGAQVTVVTGSQFTVDAPSAPPSSASTAAPPTTPTTSDSATNSTNQAIESPSPANSNLQPWDPRACPAGAKVTTPVPNQT